MTTPNRPDLALLTELADILYPYHIMSGLCLVYESAVAGDWFGTMLALNTALNKPHVRRMRDVCKELVVWREMALRTEKARAA